MDNQELKNRFKFRISLYEMKQENDIEKKKEKIFFYKKAMVACACLVLMSGVVFAKEIQTFIFQKIEVLNTASDEGYTFYKDMKQENGIYYKKINTYAEYLKYKNMWSNLLDMTEEEFKDNFMIITAAENADTINMILSDIYTLGDSLYLEFENGNEKNESSVVIGTKVSRELEKENIRIIDKLNIAINNNEYIRITEIPNNYSKEDAITDGCFVIENNKVISNNKNAINDFLESCKKNIDSYIRICAIYDNKPITITDISFSNQTYKFNILNLNDMNNILSEEYHYIKIHTSGKIGVNGEKFTTIGVNNDNNSTWYTKIMFIEE